MGEVILNGNIIEEKRICRDETGCVIGIYLGETRAFDSNLCEVGIGYNPKENRYDPNCLSGIDEVGLTLKWINLYRIGISCIDLAPLALCKKLEFLGLESNNLRLLNLSPLASCNTLKELNLKFNQIIDIDISPLASCVNLESINLSINKIKKIDLYPLWKHGLLKTIALECNNFDTISKANIINFAKEHPNCEVFY